MKRILSFMLVLAMAFSLVSCAKNEGIDQPVDPSVSEDNAVSSMPEVTLPPDTTTSDTEEMTESQTEATSETTAEVTTVQTTSTAPETSTAVTTTSEATTTQEVIEVSKEMYIKREASVREAPEESAKRMAKLEKGDKVFVSRIVDKEWFFVTCGDISGYVRSGYLSDDFVSATEAATTVAADVTTVLTSAEEQKYSPDDKLIALSFDDGPSLGSTNAILDYFEEMDIVGTFFVIGNNINSNTAEVMKRAYEMGCEIGNHSKTHQQMGLMSPSQLKEEISYVQDAVKKYVGIKPVLFRPPYINASDAMYDNIDLTFICGLDSKDWTGISAEERAQNVLNFADDGVIVLMHDGWDNWETVEAVKLIVPELLAEGYKFVTISELFEAKGITPGADKMYSEVK